MSRQKLFEAIINVTGFTPLESDMDEIQRAVLAELNLPSDDNMEKELLPDCGLERKPNGNVL